MLSPVRAHGDPEPRLDALRHGCILSKRGCDVRCSRVLPVSEMFLGEGEDRGRSDLLLALPGLLLTRHPPAGGGNEAQGKDLILA